MVLNLVLNQILSGKYAFDKSQIFSKSAKDSANWSQKLDRYIGGMSFKNIMQEVQNKLMKKQPQSQPVFEEKSDDIGSQIDLKDFFFLNKMKE